MFYRKIFYSFSAGRRSPRVGPSALPPQEPMKTRPLFAGEEGRESATNFRSMWWSNKACKAVRAMACATNFRSMRWSNKACKAVRAMACAIKFRPMRFDKGFSLMEILIALALVVGVSAALFNNFSQSRDKGQVSQAKIMISRLSDALNTFYMDCNYYPSTAEGLEALVIAPEKCESWGPEPYLKNGKIPKDPWKNEFVYEYDEASGSFEVISFGKGSKKGGEKPPHPTADISSKDL